MTVVGIQRILIPAISFDINTANDDGQPDTPGEVNLSQVF